MIESITIKNIATFDNEGIQINDLTKVNFIYGVNASGKTTISNLVHNPDNKDFIDASCSVSWKNNVKLQTLVYNKDFRERNFGNGKIAGVFTLGEATTEQIKEIEEKSQQLNTIKKECTQEKIKIENQTKEKEALEQEFENNCWKNIYKKYENTFKEAFTGWRSKKEKFTEKVLQEFSNNNVPIVTFAELIEKAKTIFNNVPQEISPIPEISFDKINEIENNLIWRKIIVGKADMDIAKLINKLNINDWVNQGRNYIQKDNICPFCQQRTITNDFRKQIENFFDETYLNDLQLLKKLKREYEIVLQNIINELNTIEANQKDIKSTKLDIDKFSAYLKTLTSQSITNKEYLNGKEKEPSRSIELIATREQFELITELIDNANKKIKEHNHIVANFQSEKLNLIKSVWRFIIEEFKTDITEFNKKKTGFETGIANLQKQLENKQHEYNTLDIEIKNLNKNVTSIQPTIDEINRLLKSFGFLNFEIVPANDKGFYQIKREDGTIAEKTLSEGEITFITFLYFLQLAKGGISEETVNNERILVIDDPISSLDSNVLFVVSSLIKEIIKDIKANKGNIKQLILLTHNIYFHKEVSYEGINRSKGELPHFWILRKNITKSTVQEYKNKNPIQSSYELLWQEIKEWKNNSGITIQNTMRRILEHFFSILGNKRDDFLINKFDSPEEKEICRSLLCWINEGSHTFNDDLYVEVPDNTIEKYLNVFKEIFIHTNNSGHYDLMMNIDNNINNNGK
jgi:wobble nucleotide-excising tRNase